MNSGSDLSWKPSEVDNASEEIDDSVETHRCPVRKRRQTKFFGFFTRMCLVSQRVKCAVALGVTGASQV